ncbi:MAG: lytic transglycosylase domain-containing protein [Rhizobiaceae bacterium]
MWPNSRFAAGIASLVLAGTPKTSAQEAKTTAKPTPPIAETVWATANICDSMKNAAEAYDLSRAYFAHLIWTESRFDIKALNRKGAQFMPATTKERRLSNPYDPARAIPSSAALLFDLEIGTGKFRTRRGSL